MGFFAYYANAAVWGTAPETKSWPTTGNNSIAVSSNFGRLSHTLTTGALPSSPEEAIDPGGARRGAFPRASSRK